MPSDGRDGAAAVELDQLGREARARYEAARLESRFGDVWTVALWLGTVPVEAHAGVVEEGSLRFELNEVDAQPAWPANPDRPQVAALAFTFERSVSVEARTASLQYTFELEAYLPSGSIGTALPDPIDLLHDHAAVLPEAIAEALRQGNWPLNRLAGIQLLPGGFVNSFRQDFER